MIKILINNKPRAGEFIGFLNLIKDPETIRFISKVFITRLLILDILVI